MRGFTSSTSDPEAALEAAHLDVEVQLAQSLADRSVHLAVHADVEGGILLLEPCEAAADLVLVAPCSWGRWPWRCAASGARFAENAGSLLVGQRVAGVGPAQLHRGAESRPARSSVTSCRSLAHHVKKLADSSRRTRATRSRFSPPARSVPLYTRM